MRPMPQNTPLEHLEKRLSVGQQTIIYHASIDDVTMTQWPYAFEPEYLKQHGHITRTVQGRGDTHFINWNGHQWVLRHYYRGGLVGKFNKDLYWNKPIEKTRAYQEWAMLLHIHHLGLPSAKPVAIRLVQGMMFHYADILTEALTNVRSLHDLLCEQAVDEQIWHSVGQVIAQFHHHGIYHDDLNAHNVLISTVDEAVYLIDFDKGDVRKKGRWMQANLKRLKRSLLKEANKAPQYGYSKACWDALLNEYQAKLGT